MVFFSNISYLIDQIQDLCQNVSASSGIHRSLIERSGFLQHRSFLQSHKEVGISWRVET